MRTILRCSIATLLFAAGWVAAQSPMVSPARSGQEIIVPAAPASPGPRRDTFAPAYSSVATPGATTGTMPMTDGTGATAGTTLVPVANGTVVASEPVMLHEGACGGCGGCGGCGLHVWSFDAEYLLWWI